MCHNLPIPSKTVIRYASDSFYDVGVGHATSNVVESEAFPIAKTATNDINTMQFDVFCFVN